jgi:hypothetical protein
LSSDVPQKEEDHAFTVRHITIFPANSFLRLSNKFIRLFEDNALGTFDTHNSDTANLTSEFARELLLTYRIIFGQDESSFKLFNLEMQRLSKKGGPSITNLVDSDPMLLTLCGQSYDSAAASVIYDDIRSGNAQTFYRPADYPFFGKKLMELQDFVQYHTPQSWSAMWYDRKRNPGHWWAFWVSNSCSLTLCFERKILNVHRPCSSWVVVLSC